MEHGHNNSNGSIHGNINPFASSIFGFPVIGPETQEPAQDEFGTVLDRLAKLEELVGMHREVAGSAFSEIFSQLA